MKANPSFLFPIVLLKAYPQQISGILFCYAQTAWQEQLLTSYCQLLDKIIGIGFIEPLKKGVIFFLLHKMFDICGYGCSKSRFINKRRIPFFFVTSSKYGISPMHGGQNVAQKLTIHRILFFRIVFFQVSDLYLVYFLCSSTKRQK